MRTCPLRINLPRGSAGTAHDRRPTAHGPRQNAFTLIEVLVALVVLAVLAGLLGQVLRGSLRIHTLQREHAADLETAREQRVLQMTGELDEPLVTLEEIEEIK